MRSAFASLLVLILAVGCTTTPRDPDTRPGTDPRLAALLAFEGTPIAPVATHALHRTSAMDTAHCRFWVAEGRERSIPAAAIRQLMIWPDAPQPVFFWVAAFQFDDPTAAARAFEPPCPAEKSDDAPTSGFTVWTLSDRVVVVRWPSRLAPIPPKAVDAFVHAIRAEMPGADERSYPAP
jgi:hypothetical protein